MKVQGFIVTLTDDQGTVIDRWELQRPEQNVESPWLNDAGKLERRDALYLGEQIAEQVARAQGG